MNFPSGAPVRAEKKRALRERLARLGVDLRAVAEGFIRSSGPGGQKANKTSSGVQLRYALPDGRALAVKWTRERSRALNRFLALRELADEIDERVSPGTSERLKVRERERRRKHTRRRRARKRAKDEREQRRSP